MAANIGPHPPRSWPRPGIPIPATHPPSFLKRARKQEPKTKKTEVATQRSIGVDAAQGQDGGALSMSHLQGRQAARCTTGACVSACVRASHSVRACAAALVAAGASELGQGQCRCRARDCTGAEVAPATFALVRCNSGRHCLGCCCCSSSSLLGRVGSGSIACLLHPWHFPRILTLQPLSLWR